MGCNQLPEDVNVDACIPTDEVVAEPNELPVEWDVTKPSVDIGVDAENYPDEAAVESNEPPVYIDIGKPPEDKADDANKTHEVVDANIPPDEVAAESDILPIDRGATKFPRT